MHDKTWHNYGYGLCTEILEVESAERIKRLIDLAPYYKEKVEGSLKVNGITEPTVVDYYAYTDDCQYGIADFLAEVLKEVTGFSFIACDDSESNGYLIYTPSYPWMMDEDEKKLDIEDVEALVKNFVMIVSDTPITLDYLSIENGEDQ